MTGGPGSHWYFREEGAVRDAAQSVVDPAPMHRANAYRKVVNGEDLTDAEREAVAATKGLPMVPTVAGNTLGDVALGFLFSQAPDLVAELDALVARWAERLGHPEVFAWQAAADYTERALAVTMEEAGFGVEDAAAHPAFRNETPERIAEVQAAWDADRKAFDNLMASPEEQARQAAVAEAMAPDGGPEGWSQIPPTNPDHPSHPDNLRLAMERHWRLVNEERAKRGLGPDPASNPPPEANR